MHAFIEFFISLIVLLAAATLSPFGVDVNAPRAAEREVQRVSDCDRPKTKTHFASAPTDC